jgi:DNA repair exonuclease SbcCD ATPase subunit
MKFQMELYTQIAIFFLSEEMTPRDISILTVGLQKLSKEEIKFAIIDFTGTTFKDNLEQKLSEWKKEFKSLKIEIILVSKKHEVAEISDYITALKKIPNQESALIQQKVALQQEVKKVLEKQEALKKETEEQKITPTAAASLERENEKARAQFKRIKKEVERLLALRMKYPIRPPISPPQQELFRKQREVGKLAEEFFSKQKERPSQ